MKDSFVFFGTPYIARDTLASLVEALYTPALVVTSPPAPQGRGMTLVASPTDTWARERAIPTLTPAKLTPEVQEEIRSYGATYAIVVAYGKILPQALLDIFPKGVLNIHYSLLPKYRGASPVEAALLHDEKTTGVSIQKMVYALDAGDVLSSREIPIEETDTTPTLRAKLIPLGASLLIDTLPAYLEGTLQGTPQDETLVSFCTRIDKKEGEISLTDDARTNWNKYRAYAESPTTYFFAERGGKKIRVKIKEAVYENNTFIPTRVVPEGKKEMAYTDFVRSLAS